MNSIALTKISTIRNAAPWRQIGTSSNTLAKTNRALGLAVLLLGCLAAGVIGAPRANAQLPDLAVANVSWTGQPVAGQSLMVSIVVTNIGAGAASGGWVDEWVLSTSTSVADAVANETVQTGNVNHSVPPGGSYTNSLTWTLLGAPSGQYYLIGVADVFNNLAESNEGNNTLAVPITLAIPDLAVTGVTFTGPAAIGEPLPVSMVVTNLGSGFANGSWYDEFVLSTSPSLADAVPNGTFEFNLGHTVPTNGSYTVNETITLPTASIGQYYLIGVADDQNNVEESNEGNNSLAVLITLDAPDLAVASVGWTGQAVAGQQLSVWLVETNLGAVAANGAWYDEFVLSSNATLAGEVPGGALQEVYNYQNGLSPAGSYTNSVTWTLPAVPAGNYYLIGVADQLNYVPESNENNNTLAVPITLAIPDLVATSVAFTGQPGPGAQLTLSLVVTNIGAGFASNSWYDAWVLSTDTTLASAIGSYITYSYSHPSLPVNGSYTNTTTGNLPAVAAGSYYLIGVADYGDQVDECTYTNNTVAVPITLGAPDLAVASVGWTGQAVAGQQLSVWLVETNLGAVAANGAWYDEFVLSSNATLAGEVPGGALQEVYNYQNGLSPAGSYTNSVTWTLPAVPAGNYYLIGVADQLNYVPESNENNNTLAVPITLAIPDLVATSVAFTGQPGPGAQLTLSLVVTNIGAGFASNLWYDAWVLSTDTTLASAIGSYITYSYSHPSLPVNGSYTNTTTGNLPAVAAGSYYLIGVADYGDQVDECTYTNNTVAVPITLGAPDLAVASVGWTGQAVAGQQLSVWLVETNIGAVAANGAWYDEFVLSSNATLAGAVPGGALQEVYNYQRVLGNTL